MPLSREEQPRIVAAEIALRENVRGKLKGRKSGGKVEGRWRTFAKFVPATSFNEVGKEEVSFLVNSILRIFILLLLLLLLFCFPSLPTCHRALEEIISHEQSSASLNFRRWTFNEFLEEEKVYNFRKKFLLIKNSGIFFRKLEKREICHRARFVGLGNEERKRGREKIYYNFRKKFDSS